MNWTPPKFDRFQFAGRRAKAVSADTHISFQDFSRMHIHRRERTQERRLPTPKWAVRNDLLREVLVVYLEERFYIQANTNLSLKERLGISRKTAERSSAAKRVKLRAWIRQYKVLNTLRGKNLSEEAALDKYAELNDGQQTYDPDYARRWITAKRLSDLEVQIQNVDTDLVLTARGHAEVIAAIVYLYYRLGWDSVAVAEQLRLKPPHVRQVLARLNTTWRSKLEKKFENQEPEIENIPSTTHGIMLVPLSAIFDGVD